MPQTINPLAVIVGASEIYSRALSVLTAWGSIGATMDDSAVRIAQTWFRPELNGMLGPVQGLDYLAEQLVEMEFSMVEVAGSKLALAVPGVTSAVTATTDDATTPFTSTLAAAAAIGDTNVKVVANTNLVAGGYVRINVAGALAEYRRIDTVGTVGAGGTGIQFRDPLQKAHLSGVACVETVGDGKTELTGSTVRRMPDTAYSQWAMVAQAPSGYYELLLDSGISVTDSAEIAFGDETAGMIRTTIQGRYAGATPTSPPWRLRVP